MATAGGLATIAVHDMELIDWSLLAFAGVVGAAGVGLARRSMTAQVLSRATAWIVLAPSAVIAAFLALSGRPEWVSAAMAAGSGGALLLARPMLHSAEATAQFHPSSYRRQLLAGATGSASAGIVTGLVAFEAMRSHPDTAIPLAAFALALIASAVGVVRMRAWGILLGGLTSAIALFAAMMMHGATGVAMALTAIPGFMLLLPVLIARRERARAEKTSSFTRVSSHVAFDDTPSRVRIATESAGGLDDERESEDESTVTASPPAQRAQA